MLFLFKSSEAKIRITALLPQYPLANSPQLYHKGKVLYISIHNEMYYMCIYLYISISVAQ